MEISLLPKLKSDSSRDDYNNWLNEFSAFVDIVVNENEMDTKGLKLLKYAVASSKLALSFDGKTTYKSALAKVEKQFKSQNLSSTPLKDFYDFKWYTSELNFGQYVIKLESLLTFIDDKKSREQLIIQHCIEQMRAEFRILLKNKPLIELIDSVSELKKSEIILVSICSSSKQNRHENQSNVCYNCNRKGHVASNCRFSKWQCKLCHSYGHKEIFCRKNSKNVSAANLLVDQLVVEEAVSTQ